MSSSEYVLIWEKSSSLLPFVYSDVFLVGVPAAIKKQLSRQVAFMQKKKKAEESFLPCNLWLLQHSLEEELGFSQLKSCGYT